MMGGEAGGSVAGNSSTRRHSDGRSAIQTPVQDSQSDGPICDTGCVSGHKRTYEEMARNNEDLARRNEKLRADLEMATALARAEQEKTKFAQKQLVNTERKLKRSKQRNKACRKATSRAKADRLTQTMGMRSDGSIGRLYTVDMDSQGKRKAIDEQWVRQDGSLKRRKEKDNNCGGLEYTIEALILMHREYQKEGLGSRKTLAHRSAADAQLRAQELRVMVPDTTKCRQGLEGKINAFSRPCDKVMRRFELCTSLLAFSRAPEVAHAANSIVPSIDGKSFGARHALGCCTDFLTTNEVARDAFDQPYYELTRKSLCMPLQEAANKVASDVKDKDGNMHKVVTPLAFGVMATLANMDEVIALMGHKVTGAFDAAADNRGKGDLQRGMDAMCSENSVLHSATVSRTVWADARDSIHKVGLFVPLKMFYERKDLQGLIEQLRKRRLNLRKTDEMAAQPRLLAKVAARLAAEKAGLDACQAAAKLDQMLSAAKQKGTEDARIKAEEAKREADAAQAAATQSMNYFKAVSQRKPSKPVLSDSLVPRGTEAVAASDNRADAEVALAGDPPPFAVADNASAVAAGEDRDSTTREAPDSDADADARSCNAPTSATAGNPAAGENPDPAAGEGREAPDACSGGAYTADSFDHVYDLPAALRPRQPPIRLNVEGAVLKCPKAMNLLFQKKIYEVLLRPVLKVQRFLRWFLRLWNIQAQERCLIVDQQRAHKEYLASVHNVIDEERMQSKMQLRSRQLLDLQVKASNNGEEFTVWCDLKRDPEFGGRREHAKALVRRAKIKRCDDWGRSLYGSGWREIGVEVLKLWYECKALGGVLGIQYDDQWKPSARSGATHSPEYSDYQAPRAMGADAGPACDIHIDTDPPDVADLSQVRDPLAPARKLRPRKFVGSQVGLGQNLTYWGLLRRRVGFVHWELSHQIRDAYRSNVLEVIGTKDGSLLGQTVWAANIFRTLFCSERPKEANQGVSMLANPARFWGCYDQRVQKEDGEFTIQETCIGLQCVSHRQHNGSGRMAGMMDREFLDGVVSMVTQLLNDNVKGHVLTNVNHLIFADTDVDKQTNFYSECRNEINRRSLLPTKTLHPLSGDAGISIQQIALDVPATGLVPPDPCAMVRWATVQKSAVSLDDNADKYAFGYGRLRGVGKTQADEVKALVSIFSHRGFVSDDHPYWVLAKGSGHFFKFLVAPQSKTQMAIVRFISKAVVEPLLAIANEKNLCSSLMMGMGSFPRALLRILSDVIWLTTGQRKRSPALGHRSDGAYVEWKARSWRGSSEQKPSTAQHCGSLRILNPKCGPAVRRVLGTVLDETWNPGMQEDIVTAVEVLFTRFKRIAAMHGTAIPDTARKILAAVHPSLYNEAGLLVDSTTGNVIEETYSIKMAQLMFMFKLTILDVLHEIRDVHRRELQSLDSFVGGMARTVWSKQKIDGKRILEAHPYALADAVVVKVMGRDVLHQLKDRFSGRLAARDPLDFFPAFASLWGNEHSRSMDIFSGVVESDQSNAEIGEIGSGEPDSGDINAAAIGIGEDDQGRVRKKRATPAHYNQVSSRQARDSKGQLIEFVDGKELFPKPLSAYPEVHKIVLRAATQSNSSKRIETPWARMAQLYVTRTRANFFTLNLHFMSQNDVTMGVDVEELALKDPLLVDAALELSRHDGWEKILELDTVKRDIMLADYKRGQAESKGVKFWKRTDHEGSHRTDRWLNFTPTEEKAFLRRTKIILERLGKKIPIPERVQHPRRRAPGHSVEPVTCSPVPQRQGTDAAENAEADVGRESLPLSDTDLPGIDDMRSSPDEANPGWAATDGILSEEAVRRSVRVAERDAAAAETTILSAYHFEKEDDAEVGLPVDAAAHNQDLSSLDVAVGEGVKTATVVEVAAAEMSAAEEVAADVAIGDAGMTPVVTACQKTQIVAVVEAPAVAAAMLQPAALDEAAASRISSDVATGDSGVTRDEIVTSGSGEGSESDSEAESVETDLESPESDSERFADIDLREEDIWTADFCWNVFQSVTPRWPRHQHNVWLPSSVSWQSSGMASSKQLVAHVTRHPTARLQALLTERHISVAAVSIKFKVIPNSGNMCYIRYSDFAGSQLVRIERVHRPNLKKNEADGAEAKDKRANTFEYRRVMRTDEALATCDVTKTSGGYLGCQDLRKILAKNEGLKRTTYHQGECVYVDGDLRELIGVVWWHTENDQPDKNGYKDYPADVLRMGANVHERAA